MRTSLASYEIDRQVETTKGVRCQIAAPQSETERGNTHLQPWGGSPSLSVTVTLWSLVLALPSPSIGLRPFGAEMTFLESQGASIGCAQQFGMGVGTGFRWEKGGKRKKKSLVSECWLVEPGPWQWDLTHEVRGGSKELKDASPRRRPTTQ